MERMKLIGFAVAVVLVVSGLCWSKGVDAPKGDESGDRTLAPYFFIPGGEEGTEHLPLTSTFAAVNIAGVIADVEVTQVYENRGKKAIEAVYVFPASTRAAVYGMRMTIGERTITAVIQKKEEARKRYDEAVREGKTASLLEQQRPNVFQMTVGNIMPGDVVKVELKYSEILVPTDGVYEFVYPTVVGPRYAGSTTSPGDRWVSNPYLKEGQVPTYTFNIATNLMTGVPVSGISSPSHKIDVRYSGPSSAAVSLAKGQAGSGNRDFILRYTLADRHIGSGLLLYEGERENFFLLTVQPPKRVAAKDIPGREYVFIVDVSGSMHGFPLDISKKLLKDLIGGLRPTDVFNVLLFSGGNTVMAEKSLPATQEHVTKAVNVIERQTGGGGTELLPALKRALSLPKAEGFSRTVVIVTDGYVTVEEEVFDLMRRHLGDANMFTFGIGSSVNRHLIEGMARVGAGDPFVVTKAEEAREKAAAFRKLIQSPVLTNISIDYRGFEVYDVDPPSVPDVLADRPVVICGKWKGRPGGTIRVGGITGNSKHSEVIDVGAAKPDKRNSALRFLWARNRVALLSDYNALRSDEGRTGEVTRLGLQYSLLTGYTSFVAVDTLVRNAGGNATTIEQPLPLPEGVSNYAVASAAPQALGVMERKTLRKELAQDAAKEKTGRSEGEEDLSLRITKVEADRREHKAGIEAVLSGKLVDMKRCLAGKGLHGQIMLSIVIKKGKVTSVTSAASKPVADCLRKVMQRWDFGAHVSTGATVTIVL